LVKELNNTEISSIEPFNNCFQPAITSTKIIQLSLCFIVAFVIVVDKRTNNLQVMWYSKLILKWANVRGYIVNLVFIPNMHIILEVKMKFSNFFSHIYKKTQ